MGIISKQRQTRQVKSMARLGLVVVAESLRSLIKRRSKVDSGTEHPLPASGVSWRRSEISGQGGLREQSRSARYNTSTINEHDVQGVTTTAAVAMVSKPSEIGVLLKREDAASDRRAGCSGTTELASPRQCSTAAG